MKIEGTILSPVVDFYGNLKLKKNMFKHFSRSTVITYRLSNDVLPSQLLDNQLKYCDGKNSDFNKLDFMLYSGAIYMYNIYF